MTLPPSRKDITGPPPRNVSDLASIVRHHDAWQRRFALGGAGGRFGTPSPTRSGASPLVGDDGGDSADDIQFKIDQATVTAAGTITMHLTFEPIEDSLHLYWGTIYVPPTDYTLDGQTVFFTNAHLKVGRVMTASYAYVDEDAEPFSLVLRGVTIGSGEMPPETELGDFVLIGTRGDVGLPGPVFTDSRFPVLSTPGTEGLVYAGNASDLSHLGPSSGSGLVVVAAFVGSAAVTGVAYDKDPPTGLSVPSQSGNAAIAVVNQRSSVVVGSISLVTPWIEADTNAQFPQFTEVGIYYWTDGEATSSPAATPLVSGGIDETEAFVITVGGL